MKTIRLGSTMVTCREFADFMMDFVEGRLPEDVRAAFEEHLAICPNCVQYLTNYREVIQLGKAVFSEPDAVLPAEVPSELVDAILAARKRAEN